MSKNIQIFSDGSIIFFFKNTVNFKKIKIIEKDHNNFFLNKKKSSKLININFSSKYKNQYLF